jgi:hypothetical protein
MGKLGFRYQLEVRDKNGKLLSLTKGDSHSFLRSWIRILQCMMKPKSNTVSTVVLKDTSNVDKTCYGSSSATEIRSVIACGADASDAGYGIVVGSSDLAFDRTHYNLQGKIAHGSGAGQLLYGAMAVEDYSETDSQARFRMTRTFTNNTGSTVTVKEIGIVFVNYSTVASAAILMARDVLTSPQAIPDGATLTVRYTLYYSY